MALARSFCITQFATAGPLALALVATTTFHSTGVSSAALRSPATPSTRIAVEADVADPVGAILHRWEIVAVEAGAHSPAWRDLYATQLRQLSAEWQQKILNIPKGDPRDAKAQYATFTNMFKLARVHDESIAKAPKADLKLGSTTRDLVFIPIVPCRIVDTRNAGGAVAAGTQRNYNYYADTAGFSWLSQGGPAGSAASACPGTALAVAGGSLGSVAPAAAAATVTVVAPTAAGNFVLWGGGNPVPTTSVLNWSPGDVLANTTVIPWGGRTGGNQDFTIRYNGPSGSADVVIDVVGYYVENAATQLSCIVDESVTQVVGNGATWMFNSAACPVGYEHTGGGSFAFETDVFVHAAPASGTETEFCFGRNVSGAQTTVRCTVVCCRVPGQ